METKTSSLVDHYQKTYELTYGLWEGRNRIFLVLLAALGIAGLVTFQALGGRSVLFLYVGHVLELKPEYVEALQKSFPFGLLRAIFLFVIFYLMVNLYHRARYVLRNYAYLGALEREIREQLGMPESAVAFTRESTFYWGNRDRFSGAVKYVYIVLLSCLLVAFLVAVVVEDWKSRHWLLTGIDLLFAFPTLTFLVAYAKASVSMDAAEAILPKPHAKSKHTH